MLPLPSPDWYRDHPRPVNSQNNYDIPMLQNGLRIPMADYEPLVNELTTAMRHSGLPFDDPTWNLRSPESRLSVSPILQGLIDKNSMKYGWHEINDKIVRDYLYELFKRWLYNKKRSLPKRSAVNPVSGLSVPVTLTEPSALQPSLQTSQPPVPRRQLSSGPTFPLTPSLSSQRPLSPATPIASSPLTPLPNKNASQVHPLHTCMVFVRRLDDGEDYEDTLDVFLKPASKNSVSEYGPNDYDFSLFKRELSKALAYNDQTDVIRYHNSERGPVNVSHDSKWRVALRYLASQAGSGVLNFEIAQEGGPSRLRHAHTINGDLQLVGASPIRLSPSSPSSATQREAASATETILANSLVEKSTPETREVAGRAAGSLVDTPLSISSDSDTQETMLNGQWVEGTLPSSSLDSDTQGEVAQTPQDCPLTTSSTSNMPQAAAQTALSSRIGHTNPQSPRETCAKTLWSAPIPKKNNVNHQNLLDDKDSSDSDVPVKRRRTLKSLRDGSGNVESKINEESISDDGIHVIYDEPSGDEAEERLPLQELTEEEHERLVQSLQDCPTLNHMTVGRWESYCTFFKHDPRKAAREDTFQIDGFLIGLFPHQVYAAMWMVERWLCGVYTLFLADGMGVGKTSTVLLIWVIQRNVLLAWEQVQICRQSSSAAERAKHLPVDQEEGSVCPTNPFCIQCPCENDSVTLQFLPVFRSGPVLVVAPGGNVNIWRDECQARIDTKNKRLNLQWHVAYNELSLSGQVLAQIRCDIDTLKAKPGQERHLVISSNGSFYNKVITPALQFRQLSQRKRENPETARHPITWSIMARDEYHTAKGVNTIMSEYFRQARTGRPKERPNAPVTAHRGRPLKLAISGTMFEGSPKDLLGHFVDSVDYEWTQGDSRMHECTPQRLKELARTYEKIVVDLGLVSNDRDRRIMNKRIRTYTRELNQQLRLVLIRRTGPSKFFGYTIVPLAPMDVREIACRTQDQWLESIAEYAAQTQRELAAEHAIAVKNWERRGRPGPQPVLLNSFSKSNTAYYLRLAADFAAIPHLHKRHPDWTFHAEEVYRIDWDRVPEDNLYAIHLETLIGSSTKILHLNKILADMRQRSAVWIAKGERKEKMVLTTAHPAALGILYLYFKQYKKDWKVVMVSASPKVDIKKRIQIVNGFCGRTDSPYYKHAFDADILLTTTPCVGTGLNLTVANVVLQFDLLWMRKDQQQAFCRVHRFPQERETYLYLLHSPGNPIERDCLERQRRRGQLGDMTWQVTTGEAEAEQLKAQRRAEQKARLNELECTV